MLNVKNEQFKKYSIIFKDAGTYSRTTRCFSIIKDITSFDRKFKDNSWRSRASGNLSRDADSVMNGHLGACEKVTVRKNSLGQPPEGSGR